MLEITLKNNLPTENEDNINYGYENDAVNIHTDDNFYYLLAVTLGLTSVYFFGMMYAIKHLF